MKSLHASLLLILNFIISFSVQAATECTKVTEIPPTECEALLSLYENTQEQVWTESTGWNLTQTPCSWYGITCENNHVVKINLAKNNLKGTIPAKVAKLSNLQQLILANNQLSGTIPAALADLSNLQFLFLDFNQLNGVIPAELGKLSNLQSLYLSENQLSGAIPPELGKLSKLQYLSLYNNQLSGAIPPELGNLSKLQNFSLSHNYLCGDIPPSLEGSMQFSGMGYSLGYNALNTTVSDPEWSEYLNKHVSDWKRQTASPDFCTVLPGLGQRRIAHIQGEEVFTQAFFKASFIGGIAVDQGNYQQQATFFLDQQVDIRGIIKVASEDIGKTADIFIYAETTFPFSSGTFYYGLDEDLNIYQWDQYAESLVPLIKKVSLNYTHFISFAPWTFYYPGTLKIFFGYRLDDTTLVNNQQAIDIEIKE